MKRLVLCFDGTWNAVNDPDTVTNVVKFAQAIKPTAADGTKQIVYYNSGVGSGGKFDRIFGGVFGFGLQGNVKRGLAFLSLNYEGLDDNQGQQRKVYRNGVDYDDGDEIYLFGFSRGAYSARALSGVIGGAGIPKQMDFHELEKVWDYYRLKPSLRPKLVEDIESHAWHPRVKCIGVWDTVGSYGIPSGFGLGALGRVLVSWTRGFHDREFGKHIGVGLHAMAVDEMRRPFAPTIWIRRKDDPPLDAAVEQVWFAGAHSNVGGGYAHCGLSDLALTWMIARVGELTPLEFDEHEIRRRLWPCSACTLYRSNRGWPLSRWRPYIRGVLAQLAARPRLLRWLRKDADSENINEKVHWSVIERQGYPAALVEGAKSERYSPAGLAAIPGDRVAECTELERRIIEHCRGEAGDGFQKAPPHCDCITAKRGDDVPSSGLQA
jgi:uncharacterized protein (DUF2235 family)